MPVSRAEAGEAGIELRTTPSFPTSRNSDSYQPRQREGIRPVALITLGSTSKRFSRAPKRRLPAVLLSAMAACDSLHKPHNAFCLSRPHPMCVPLPYSPLQLWNHKRHTFSLLCSSSVTCVTPSSSSIWEMEESLKRHQEWPSFSV